MKDSRRKYKIEILKSLFWDYNFPADKALELLIGKREKLGHYTRETLFKKLIETYPWHTIIQLIPESLLINLLSDDLIKSIRHKSLKSNFEYAKKRLQEHL